MRFNSTSWDYKVKLWPNSTKYIVNHMQNIWQILIQFQQNTLEIICSCWNMMQRYLDSKFTFWGSISIFCFNCKCHDQSYSSTHICYSSLCKVLITLLLLSQNSNQCVAISLILNTILQNGESQHSKFKNYSQNSRDINMCLWSIVYRIVEGSKATKCGKHTTYKIYHGRNLW